MMTAQNRTSDMYSITKSLNLIVCRSHINTQRIDQLLTYCLLCDGSTKQDLLAYTAFQNSPSLIACINNIQIHEALITVLTYIALVSFICKRLCETSTNHLWARVLGSETEDCQWDICHITISNYEKRYRSLDFHHSEHTQLLRTPKISSVTDVLSLLDGDVWT
jgi:hypothetical protein